ncbi:MAG: hypothetical protein II661_02385 [Bacteroidales bacterium]|nr:hypothetical protein [Bacteroidales bacterium]
MKRWIVIVVGLATAALGGAALWNICSHRVVKSELSEVYNRYKDRSDLRVAFVKDYRIDDSTTVDVTTLTAKDSASWESLMREMNKPESLIELMRKAVDEGRYNVTGYYCEVEHPELTTPYKEGNSWYVILNPTERTIYIYQLSNCKARSIIKNKLKEVKDKAKNY